MASQIMVAVVYSILALEQSGSSQQRIAEAERGGEREDVFVRRDGEKC